MHEVAPPSERRQIVLMLDCIVQARNYWDWETKTDRQNELHFLV